MQTRCFIATIEYSNTGQKTFFLHYLAANFACRISEVELKGSFQCWQLNQMWLNTIGFYIARVDQIIMTTAKINVFIVFVFDLHDRVYCFADFFQH